MTSLHRPVVVGIGASAGGLEALRLFFEAMPPETGLAFVVVMHLDPTHKSLIAELLSHSTRLTVAQAQDGQPLAADHVYVIPPNRTMTLERGRLRVREADDRRSLRGTIDRFFRSLARAEGGRAVAIVLSGTGMEGTLGARAVKAEGGLVMAQAPDTAVQPGMPASVIATGLVDVVLAPDKLPDVLLRSVRQSRAPDADRGAQKEKRPRPEALDAILAVLREGTKHDFYGYKEGTLQRRIERRMGLQQMETVPQYLEFLRAHPAEVEQLSADLLIGVTSFFRDPAAFEELARHVLAPLVQGRGTDAPIRVWVPGCSTGEEAYSIAIALAEQIEAAHATCRMQIFATDVDEGALALARTGSYPESIALDVTAERLQRFFVREDHRYTITKSIRESVAFAVQNLTSDPPFSKLDLVSCRNVLIYLRPAVQEKVLSLFHFALNPGGYLFLGSAEGIGSFGDLFVPVSKRWRILRRAGHSRRIPEFPSSAVSAPTAQASALGVVDTEPTVAALADDALLRHMSPTAVVVRSSGQILRLYGAIARYLALPKGEATLDVLGLARAALKPPLRAALQEAVRRNRETVLETLGAGRDGRRAPVRITVRPLDARRTGERLWLILFEQGASAPRGSTRTPGRGEAHLVKRLEGELRATQKEQRLLVQQLERSNEELRAANEEVLSMNEELQSTNEELTTSKEELQSMNEELTTLNAQLQDKLHELTAVNDDLANLLVSTDVATVFLDTELRIKRFTTAASTLLNLRTADAGRPISHIASNLVEGDLARDARRVLETATPVQRDAAAHDGRQYLLRVLPYRTVDRQVGGVVLTLVDVTSLKQTERELRTAREQVSGDLMRMTRLHELSVQSAGSGDMEGLLANVARAAVEITGAATGDIQRCDDTGTLTLVAQAGCSPGFVDAFGRISRDTRCACALAAATRQRVLVDDVTTSPILSGEPGSALAEAGVRAVQSTPLFERSGRFLGVLSTHYAGVHQFEAGELRWLDLLARHAADIIETQLRQEQLSRAREELEQRVADRTRWLSLMHDVARAINQADTWDDALHRVLRRLCETEHWQIGFVYVPRPGTPDVIAPVVSCFGEERFRAFHDLSMRQMYARGDRLPGRVYAENKTFWAVEAEALLDAIPVRAATAAPAGLRAGVALPVAVQGEVVAVLELFSDHAHPVTDQLSALMDAVGDQISRILERQHATARMADLVWREQQELLHTLHDSLGQTLTGLGMLSTGLRQRLAASPESAAIAAEIAGQAQQALEQVRLLSRGLFPVEVDAESLVAALRDLALATARLYPVEVRVDGDAPAGLHDGKVATELYRIAQEAVTNSVRHSGAKTITVRLTGGPGLTRLVVADDGIGIPEPAPGNGAGLRIMRYRAASIGASLTVERGNSGGTVVTCTMLQTPSADRDRT